MRTMEREQPGQRLGVDLGERIERLLGSEQARYRRLWNYYRNPLAITGVRADENGSDRPYRQAQEWGLPSRITGVRSMADGEARPAGNVARKDVVIENNIGWRVDAGVDYLFGRNVEIRSAAKDPARRATITRLLKLVMEHNGGTVMLQQLALLGSIHGFVDVVVKCDRAASDGNDPSESPARGDQGPDAPLTSDGGSAPAKTVDQATDDALRQIARRIRFEIVEPARALPLVSPEDGRTIVAYGQVWTKDTGSDIGGSQRRNWRNWLSPLRRSGDRHGRTIVLELITPDRWERWEDDRLIDKGDNSLGVVPVAHIQNLPLPFSYAGLGDVEPLIALQDELNTRLSDRANRIALQSFKMYLGKGIEGFIEQPVAPGRMWMTDNPDAAVEEFGGDASCPSEESHIADIREAMDKISTVTPIAAGAIKDRIGNLTSAAALRITLLALLSKTQRKRTTYGEGISRMCELALAWLEKAGLFRTGIDERAVELHWASPLPENDMEKLREAEMKLRIGVNGDVVRRELGYGD